MYAGVFSGLFQCDGPAQGIACLLMNKKKWITVLKSSETSIYNF